MSDTLLKKDFKEKDLRRLRNIITKKYGDSVSTQVGYSKSCVEHVEGDIWEENSKMWTIKDGIKQTYTKLDEVKMLMRMPLLCPECKKTMKDKMDKKMYPLYKKCYGCVISHESKLKLEGKYIDYADSIINNNILTHIEEAKQFIEEFMESKTEQFVTEQGDIEDFEGGMNKKKIAEIWKKELDELAERVNNNPINK
jgi:hypothetical protein